MMCIVGIRRFRFNVIVALIGLVVSAQSLAAKCQGKFVNPVTDICWECLFPITVASVNVTSDHKDFESYSKIVCTCPGLPPKVGIPMSFWEPSRLVDVTRSAYCLMGMGGISLGEESVKNRGSVGRMEESGTQNSFYHVHWYVYPVIAWLEILTDFLCIEREKFDIAYMSELDPFWNDPEWGSVMNPEGLLFANPLAQAACLADCTASSLNKPMNALFWCAGCEGSLYPLTGAVAHHVGGLQASSLVMQRTIAKLHRMLALRGFASDEFCEDTLMLTIQKTLYKHQLVYPTALTEGPCHALGRSDLLWGFGKTKPVSGEDFTYLVWRKRHCCLDLVKPAAAATGTGM